MEKLRNAGLAAALLGLLAAGALAWAADDRALCVNHCENAYVLDALECRSNIKGPSRRRCVAFRERRYELCTERCDREEQCRVQARGQLESELRRAR